MKAARMTAAVMAVTVAAGCVTTETVRFESKPQQMAMVRDGRHAIVSKRKGSLVLVSPAARQFQSGARPVFVVGITNLTGQPLDFAVANISVVQKKNGEAVASLPVVTYEQLVSEERARQVAAAILVGLAAGANAAVAARSGHITSESTIYSRGRIATVTTQTYSPALAAVAQANASARNEAMIEQAIETGRANLAVLEQSVLKDNTLMPGEWYGGQLHFAAPAAADQAGPKTYSIAIAVGPDTHEIDVVQEPVKG